MTVTLLPHELDALLKALWARIAEQSAQVAALGVQDPKRLQTRLQLDANRELFKTLAAQGGYR